MRWNTKIETVTAIAVLLATPILGRAQEPVGAPSVTVGAPKTEAEKSSYSAGFSFGRSLEPGSSDLALEQVLAGVRDGLSGEPAQLSEEEIRVLTRQLALDLRALRQAAQEAAAAKNKADGEAFLATNAERPAVVTLASGLQYEVLRQGDGPRPAAADTVEIHLHGTLLDGTVFDSSRERGQPAVLMPMASIPGLAEAIPMMAVGSIWKLYLPHALGYGEGPAGVNIPAASTLVYEAELLAILEAPQGDDSGG